MCLNRGQAEDKTVELVLSFIGWNVDYQVYVACAVLDAQPYNLTPVGMTFIF